MIHTNTYITDESEVTQSCPTLCGPMDYSLPGSSIHGIFQARVLEWGAIAFSKYSDQAGLNVADHLSVMIPPQISGRRLKPKKYNKSMWVEPVDPTHKILTNLCGKWKMEEIHENDNSYIIIVRLKHFSNFS